MNTTSPARLLPPLSPFQGFALGWSRYAEFRGRSSRMEFWSFQIINFFIGLLLSFFFVFPGVIYSFLTLIPTLSVWTRRVHDIGHSGWWIFWAFGSVGVAFVVLGLTPEVIPESINLFGASVEAMTLAVWFVVVMNLIPFLMGFVDSSPKANKYGPNPKLNPTDPNNPI